MSSDIVQRLRRITARPLGLVIDPPPHPLCKEAADAIEARDDEIERLRAEVERVEGQRKLRADLAYVMKAERDDALAEVMRLRTAGDALVGTHACFGFPDPLIAAWQEARREQ